MSKIKDKLGRYRADPEWVALRLSERYGDPHHFNRVNPLEELIFIIFSLQTDETKYREAFARLRASFPTFELLSKASADELTTIVGPAGLGKQKGVLLRRMFDAIIKQCGRLSLASLRHMDNAACEAFLTGLPGVGLKTARCVMMYSLQRDVFPVDTHCWRICRRLGWIRPTRPDRSCSPKDMDRLQQKIPTHIRHGLHVNLISLGRDLCRFDRAQCEVCPLVDRCPQIGIKDVRANVF